MSSTDLALDVIRKKVFFHNSIDVWISACEEKNLDWFNIENYKKFISYLLKNTQSLIKLCAPTSILNFGINDEKKNNFFRQLFGALLLQLKI